MANEPLNIVQSIESASATLFDSEASLPTTCFRTSGSYHPEYLMTYDNYSNKENSEYQNIYQNTWRTSNRIPLQAINSYQLNAYPYNSTNASNVSCSKQNFDFSRQHTVEPFRNLNAQLQINSNGFYNYRSSLNTPISNNNYCSQASYFKANEAQIVMPLYNRNNLGSILSHSEISTVDEEDKENVRPLDRNISAGREMSCKQVNTCLDPKPEKTGPSFESLNRPESVASQVQSRRCLPYDKRRSQGISDGKSRHNLTEHPQRNLQDEILSSSPASLLPDCRPSTPKTETIQVSSGNGSESVIAEAYEDRAAPGTCRRSKRACCTREPNEGLTRSGDRRSRTSFTGQQLTKLESVFEKVEILDFLQRDILAGELNLPSDVIRIWFKNRRAKQRREGVVCNKTAS